MQVRTPPRVIKLKQSHTKALGQGMTEYLVILGLIAIAAIAAFSYFGQTVRSQVAGMAQEVGGGSGAADVALAKGAADNASAKAAINTNMSTYVKGGNDGVGGAKGGK